MQRKTENEGLWSYATGNDSRKCETGSWKVVENATEIPNGKREGSRTIEIFNLFLKGKRDRIGGRGSSEMWKVEKEIFLPFLLFLLYAIRHQFKSGKKRRKITESEKFFILYYFRLKSIAEATFFQKENSQLPVKIGAVWEAPGRNENYSIRKSGKLDWERGNAKRKGLMKALSTVDEAQGSREVWWKRSLDKRMKG